MLNFLRKGTKVEHNLAAARVCKRLGLRIWANYMLGLPTETKDDIMATVGMLKEIDRRTPVIHLLSSLRPLQSRRRPE